MRTSRAHIAGVGVTELPKDLRLRLDKYAVSAATKALLDAGITYSDVDTTIACFLDDETRVRPASFDVFGKRGAPICQIDNHSGLPVATMSVKSRQSEVALLVGIEKDEQQSQIWLVGMIIVSDLFLTSHAYLKDGSVEIRGIAVSNSIYSASTGGPDLTRTVRSTLNRALRQAQVERKDVQVVDTQHSASEKTRKVLNELDVASSALPGTGQSLAGNMGLAGVCGLVWQLRGWASSLPRAAHNCLQIVVCDDGFASTIVLRRSDGRAALSWEEVQNIRDGRERLGYNPAVEMKDISREDLAGVMANAHFVPIEDPGDRLGLAVKGGDRAALARL